MLGQLLLSAVDSVANTKHRMEVQRLRNQIVDSSVTRSLDVRSRYSRKPIDQEVTLEPQNVLGTGCSGPVIRAVEHQSGMDRAVKVYRKQELSLSRLHSLQKEVNIYLMLSHPNIVKLHNVYESNETVHLSMELCSGGELYTRLKQKGNFSEKSAARAAFQMLSAIEHLHMQGIVHRDLKLENWLYESDAEDAPLKLADFGFSTKWNGREPMHESCGTTSYLAPEVFQGNYTEKCDMWSFGVIMFALLNGKMPFVGKDRELVDRILECEYSFQNHISEEAQDFVEGLLKLNPENRMSASECLVHPWITQHVIDNTTCCPQQLSALPSLLVRSRSAMEYVAIIPQKVTRGGA